MDPHHQLVQRERSRRRTFAIISHPDAGKTTLTEKLLLFGGSIEVAGAVRGRKSQRAARSDWMELERQRGISVSSTVLTFDYQDFQINLLDTPGHHDFSEDTYRTLMAADVAVMVIDAAKGIETQTEKLYRVCAKRNIPIITFVNKIDRPSPSPLAIIDEIEQRFGIATIPLNWPVGTGLDFAGIIDLSTHQLNVYQDRSGDRRSEVARFPWNEIADTESASRSSADGSRQPKIQEGILQTVVEELELIESVYEPFNVQRFLDGSQTPVLFGSALANFGIELFLQSFVQVAPAPGDLMKAIGMDLSQHTEFSGFIFKIQANLDPRHRDRVAFMRVCTGRFERDMEVTVARTGKQLRLPRALRIFGQERQTMEEAYPGDIIGVVSPGEFRLGDTLHQAIPVRYPGIPQFSPEVFARVECPDTSRRKQFDRGLNQLVEEGAVQIFCDLHSRQRQIILAAVGELQLDVVRFRLETEYNAPSSLYRLEYSMARWFDHAEPTKLRLPYGVRLVRDHFGHPAVLLTSKWDLFALSRDNPEVQFDAIRDATEAATII
jgi:peptide chain release factor 3